MSLQSSCVSIFYSLLPPGCSFSIIIVNWLSDHTLAVRECCNGDDASQWKRPKFDPAPCQNPFADLQQNWRAWLCRGYHLAYAIFSASVQWFLLLIYPILPCHRRCCVRFGVATSYSKKTPKRILHKIVKGRCFFLLFRTPVCRKTAILGTFCRDLPFTTENRFNKGYQIKSN